MNRPATSEAEAKILALIARPTAEGPVRVDRWAVGSSWSWRGFRPAREIEVWQFPDGRRTRIIRYGNSQEWQLERIEDMHQAQ